MKHKVVAVTILLPAPASNVAVTAEPPGARIERALNVRNSIDSTQCKS